MATLKEIDAQLAALQTQREEIRRQEIKGVVEQIRKLADDYGLTANDVFPSARGRAASTGQKVAPKYRDPATGVTWTGRGKPPKWIDGQDRAKFAI